MRNSRFGIGVVALATIATIGSAQEKLISAPRVRIAVMDITGTALSVQSAQTAGGSNTTVALPPPPEFARGLTQMLTTALASRPEFIVVERVQLDKVTAEQQLATTGRVELASAPAVGKLLGAQTLITGDITEFTYKQSSAGSKLSLLKSIDSKLGAKMDKVTAKVAVDLRIIDATTGVVIGSVRGEGDASATGVSAEYAKEGRELGLGGSKQTPLGTASREAIEQGVAQLLKKLQAVPWQGRVADVRGDKVYINAGSDIGIKSGMQFEVFVQSAAVIDPESGATLGSPDQRSGQLTITEVQARFAIGRITEGAAPKRNDVVRFRSSSSNQ